MSEISATSIASQFTEYYGLEFEGSSGRGTDGQQYVQFFPAEVHRSEGFGIRLTIGWRSLEGKFIHGAWSASIIREMGLAAPEKRSVFSELAGRLVEEKATIQMTVNQKPVDPIDPSEWPEQWGSLSIVFRKSRLEINTEDSRSTENAILQWGGRFLEAILALVPLEETETAGHSNDEGLPEGAVTKIEVNRYERSPFNRAACIRIHGDTCKACGFNFGRVYGEQGKGFIHVHHVTQVSEMGEDYRVDPARDLVPLCPNCHAMAHTSNPPLTVQEIKALLALKMSDG